MLTIAIPTYERGAVLCDTIEHLLALRQRADEIVIVDQTPAYPPEVTRKLQGWADAGAIRWIRLERPSIPRAMNTALEAAKGEQVLFLDDDIIPLCEIVTAHVESMRDPAVWATVGQVLEPGDEPEHIPEEALRRGILRDLEFRFTHDTACDVQNVIACNLSVRRDRALAIGGFDEHYSKVAYRFETDFALRLIQAGGRVRFHPAASIRHLRAPGGGVRAWGDHRSSPSPAHSMGDYYFARTHVPQFWLYVRQRMRRNVLTRYHMRHPWAIPLKLIGETRGLLAGLRLARETSRPPVAE